MGGEEEAPMANQSAAITSEGKVLVEQCKLRRSRFVFQGQAAHSIDNFGGKSLPLKSFRT
jgi:hypothetical protein